MLSQIKFYACAVFIVLAVNQPSQAETVEQANNIPIPPVIESAGQSDEFSEIVSPRSASARFMETTLAEIARWLTENFELPAADAQPRIEFASRSKLATMRYQGVSPDEWRGDSATHSMQPAPECEVVALYYDPTRTIYLSTDWTGENPADVSVLVHEMVHHLQNLAGLKFECLAAREKLAYLAQDQWLQLQGSSLEKEFEIDKFTVVLKSACLS